MTDTHSQRFGQWVKEAARAAGYDVDTPRGGGRTALAHDTGMSLSSVGRMLAGHTVPDPAYLESLALALRVPVTELLVRSGVCSREALGGGSDRSRSLSPREAAAVLGLHDPVKVELFEVMVRALLREQNSDAAGS